MNKGTRLYELDWLRVFAIIVLLYFHTGMIFVRWGWHIQDLSDGPSPVLEHVMAWLHYWRMPLLLFVSGAGSYFALGFRSPRLFVSERFKRLFIPLLIGMFLIVPPQIYYEKIAQFRSYADFYPTVFQFIPYPEGNFSWHHLWFILYLLLYSLVGLPLFLYLRSDRSSRLRDRVASLLERKGGLALPLIPFFLVAGALRPFFPEETHALIDDWAYFAHYGLFYLYGYLAGSEPRIWAAIRSQYRLYLLLAALSLIPFYFAYHVRIGFLWDSSRILVGWLWVIAIIGLGQRFLSFNKPFLKHVNEAIYPFYILHQTAIVGIGFYVIQWHLNMGPKFMITSTLAALASIALYLTLIRPFNFTRFLFGMKPIAGKPTVAEAKKTVGPVCAAWRLARQFERDL